MQTAVLDATVDAVTRAVDGSARFVLTYLLPSWHIEPIMAERVGICLRNFTYK